MSEPVSPAEVLRQLGAALEGVGVRDYAFTGALAVGVWASPRETRDIDLVGVLPVESVDRLLAQHDGIRSGPAPVPDLVRFRMGDWDVDLFVVADSYARECLARAVEADVLGLRVRVVTAEDLLVHKLQKLRANRRRVLQDVADMRAVAEAQGERLDREYLRRWLPPEEFALVEALRSLDDEQVLRRILGAP